jgi:putative lipase involved disintegration of autophagic bodies
MVLLLVLRLACRVVVTGHSLGAALATLGAFWLKTIMPSVSDCRGGLLHAAGTVPAAHATLLCMLEY